MKRVAIAVLAAVMLSGCATSAFVEQYSREARAVRAVRAPSGDVVAAVDVADSDTWAAFKAHPFKFIGRLLVDAVTIAGGAAVGKVAWDAVDGDSGDTYNSTTVTAGGNVNYGTGTQTQTSDNHSTETAGDDTGSKQ